jgi:endonuclease/exonuclease/phosphatase family metal-dependent hydrolase
VYNDNKAMAVSFLKREGLILPCLSIMTGDFNCHSMVWDPSYDTHGAAAARLLELIQDLELDWDPPANPGPTHVPHVETLNHTVIDLIFTPPGVAIELPQRRMVKLQGPSDHIPLLGKIRIRPSRVEVSQLPFSVTATTKPPTLLSASTGYYILGFNLAVVYLGDNYFK